MSSVDASRREFERRLQDVREAMGREVGFVPAKLGWLIPLVAISAGLALAFRSKGRSRPKRR